MRRPAATALSLLVVVLLLCPSSARAATGNYIASPRSGSPVPRGRIPVRVHVVASLVGSPAAILIVRGWLLRVNGQPQGSFDYETFSIPSQNFTVHAPRPARSGRYTIRINRDLSGNHSAIAQVRVLYTTLTVSRPRTSIKTLFSLIRDGYRDCTILTWSQSLAGRDALVIVNKGRIDLGHRGPGSNRFRWCGTLAGHKLSPRNYYVRLAVREDFLGRSILSSSLAIGVRTAHLSWNWKVTRSGASTLGYHTYHATCHYYVNALQWGDALIDCNRTGVGSLFWKMDIPSKYAIGRYTYSFRWGYRYRSAHNNTTGQFWHAWARSRYALMEIGQAHSWLEIVSVIAYFHLETTV